MSCVKEHIKEIRGRLIARVAGSNHDHRFDPLIDVMVLAAVSDQYREEHETWRIMKCKELADTFLNDNPEYPEPFGGRELLTRAIEEGIQALMTIDIEELEPEVKQCLYRVGFECYTTKGKQQKAAKKNAKAKEE